MRCSASRARTSSTNLDVDFTKLAQDEQNQDA
jgi:hypothetical protein